MAMTKLSSKKKMRTTLFVTFLILICLLVRIGYIQFIQGGELSTLAYQQQVNNSIYLSNDNMKKVLTTQCLKLRRKNRGYNAIFFF